MWNIKTRLAFAGFLLLYLLLFLVAVHPEAYYPIAEGELLLLQETSESWEQSNGILRELAGSLQTESTQKSARMGALQLLSTTLKANLEKEQTALLESKTSYAAYVSEASLTIQNQAEEIVKVKGSRNAWKMSSFLLVAGLALLVALKVFFERLF